MTDHSDSSPRSQLRQVFISNFELHELKDALFDVGADFFLFAYQNKHDFSHHLLPYLEQRRRLSCFVVEMLTYRFAPAIAHLLPSLPPCQSLMKLQVVMGEVTSGWVERLTTELAERLELTREQVVVVAGATHTLRLLVALPPEAGQRLVEVGERETWLSPIVACHAFATLDPLTRTTWRLLARRGVFGGEQGQLHPTMVWEETVREALNTLHTSQSLHLISTLCQRRVSDLPASSEELFYPLTREHLALRITEIVRRNWLSGRLNKVMIRSGQVDTLAAKAIEAYVDKVIETFLREQRMVEPLLSGDPAAWESLRARLARRAASLLARRAPHHLSVSNGEDVAQKVCQRILLSPFPYDVYFEAWLTLILTREVGLLNRSTSQESRHPTQALSLDQPIGEQFGAVTLHEGLSDEAASHHLQQLDTYLWLMQAISNLKPEYRKVLLHTYVDDLSDAQIQVLLGKRTKAAVATLRFRAIKALRKQLQQEEENGTLHP